MANRRLRKPLARPLQNKERKKNMYCPTCGKETPENSAFCLHCGAKILSPKVAPAQSAILEWEEDDFIYSWSHKQTYYDSGKWTEAQVRAELWMNFQAQITSQIQKMYDDGWQPIGEVSPSNINLNYFSEFSTGAWLFMGIITGGIFLLFPFAFTTKYIEPTIFRISMRRPVKAGTVKKVKSVFDVVLLSCGSQKIEVIKVIRQLAACGLGEAKNLSESSGSTILMNVPKSTAETARAKLESVGATVQLR